MNRNLQAVTSSNIAGYGYVPETQKLVVQFVQSGDIYVYSGVPQSVVDQFNAAPSKGSFLNANVKKAGYAAQKITDSDCDAIFASSPATSRKKVRAKSRARIRKELETRYGFLQYAF